MGVLALGRTSDLEPHNDRRVQVGSHATKALGGRQVRRESSPADLLNQVDRLRVIQLLPGTTQALAEPLTKIGRSSHVDEERVGDAELPAHFPDHRDTVRHAGAVVDIPAE